MANVTKAAESLIYLLKETNYAGVDELKASTLEWAFVGAEESESAGAILNWLTYSLDAEENALTDEEIDCYRQLLEDGLVDERELTAVEVAEVFGTSLNEKKKHIKQVEETIKRYEKHENRLGRQYTAMTKTLEDLTLREDELQKQLHQLEQELERQEDVAIDSASLWFDTTLEESVKVTQNRLKDMAPSDTNKQYLFHCREELGRVAKVNERFTGRIEQLLQRQFTKVTKDSEEAICHIAATPETEVLGPTLEQRALMDNIVNGLMDAYPKTLRAFIIAEIEKEQLQGRWDALQVELGRLDTAWSENNTNLRHVLEQSCERKEKLQMKVAGHTSDTNSKLGDYLGQITQQRIYQPIVACANAWSLRQKQHRIERLDIIIDLLLEQHILHQLLTTTFDLEQKYCMKCQKTILHLCTRLEQWSTVHQQRMNKMKHPFYSTGISLEDKHNEKDNESMLSVDQLLNQIISSIGVEGREGETLDEDIITKSIYSPRNTTCSMALSLMHELKETNRQLSQVSTERNGQLHDLRQAKNTIYEILQRFSSTHDTLNYPKDELDQAVILRQKINKLRPCLAEIAKNQQASSLLTAKRDMFCEFLLNSDQFIGNRS